MSKVGIQFHARNLRLKEKGMSYQEYLASDLWKDIRARLHERDDYSSCIVCRRNSDIQIHHLKYKYIFSEKLAHHIKSTVPVCGRCHEYLHHLSNTRNFSLKQALKSTLRKKARMVQK